MLQWDINGMYPLVMTNIAMEAMALIEIDGLPFLKIGIFHGKLLNNQRVVLTIHTVWSILVYFKSIFSTNHPTIEILKSNGFT